MSLPEIIPVSRIAEWLPKIFPEGTANRVYVVREIAAKTLFVMLYTGAVEGSGRFIRPDQVTKMTDAQAAKGDAASREKWAEDSMKRGAVMDLSSRWYQPNTREPIRDETLRLGLVTLGAVIERRELPTTSAKPRYAIASHFATLLQAVAKGSGQSDILIEQWQASFLSPMVLNRINLLRRGTIAISGTERLQVIFPNGEVRLMRPGPSSVITKAVVEQFAPSFLREPGVIFLSESGDKVVARDEVLAESIGLRLDYGKNLPDIILADVSPMSPKLVFIEVVATDGPVNQQRKEALLRVAEEGGYAGAHVHFISAFRDRGAPAFKKLVSEIAWGTFVWFMSEPDKIIAFREKRQDQLTDLI
jgi:hypothetical protein